MSYFLPKGDYVMMYVILCISIHMMLIVLFVCFPVTFSVNGNSISIEVLTGLNFKKWKEDFSIWNGAGGCSHCSYKR